MFPARTLIVINVSLVFIAFLLILNLFGVQITPLGQAAVPREGLCVINYKDQFTATNDLDRCCFEAAKQLQCQRDRQILEQGQTEWVCQTGVGGVRILLDNDARRYCVKQPYY
ncbi:MAG TPA: hypothetical protein VJH68_04115 [Candidatus Nanoarchaeia archaeon]|nr:hypothetical protein [Candidatus Nanoarchaeia archaeon]